MTSVRPELTTLARLGLRSPADALRELPLGWESDPNWRALLGGLGTTADPDACLRRLVAIDGSVLEAALVRPELARPLVAVLGFSEYLFDLLRRLAQAGHDPLDPPNAETDLLGFHDARMLYIAGADLVSPPSREVFEATGRALADAADVCVAQALGDAPGLAVMAMGKYGGGELNYASDIDILFVYDGPDVDAATVAARRVMQTLNGPPTILRTDADLRPEGRDGALVRSLDAYEAYYRRWAQAWEFQSLIKCRFAAGDERVGAAFLELAEPFVWPERLPPAAIEQVRALKGRVEREMARQGLTERQVKLAPGGIRDVEFAVQLLQLVHGRHHPGIRTPNTLAALDALGAEGFVGLVDAQQMAEAYVFLRHTEHRLQLVQGRQTHTLPAGAVAREHIARGLGYADTPATGALEAFEDDWRRTTAIVRRIHEALFYRPLLEVFATTPSLAMGAEQAQQRLSFLGFDRPARAAEAIASLTRGSSRRAKVMRAILPGLLSWLAETPDPDAGLARLVDVAVSLRSHSHLLAGLRDHPPAAELLCKVLGTGPVLASLIARDSGLVGSLGAPAKDRLRPALVAEALAVVLRAETTADSIAALRRFRNGEWLGLAAEDLGAGAEPGVFASVSLRLTGLGDACLEAALALARADIDAVHGRPPGGRIAAVAMGRYGGSELNHQSDLDVMFVYDGDEPCPDGMEPRVYFAMVAEAVLETLAAVPPIFKVDTEIRPEGREGQLVGSLQFYRQYYERRARVWEFQALLRARHAAGDESLTADLQAAVAPLVWREQWPETDIIEIRRIKARMETERIKSAEQRRFHLKLGTGGLSDVEFTVQLLQLVHGHRLPEVRTASTLAAVAALRDAGELASRDAAWLLEAFLFLNRVRNHLYLLRGLPTDVVPTRDDEVERLARSLGYGRLARSRFLDDYRRVTRRARRICERLFYEDVRPGGATD